MADNYQEYPIEDIHSDNQPEPVNPNQINLIEEPEHQTVRGGSWAFGIAAIVAGLLVISAGYVVYRYFDLARYPLAEIQNNVELADTVIPSTEKNGNDSINLQPQVEGEDNSGISGRKEIDSIGIADSNQEQNQESNPQVSGVSTINQQSSDSQGVQQIPAGTRVPNKDDYNGIQWVPNNYEFGDITGDSHTVIRGDTLWEVADGKYGNPRKWTTIDQANNVGRLPNGNPLITPGQVLQLP